MFSHNYLNLHFYQVYKQGGAQQKAGGVWLAFGHLDFGGYEFFDLWFSETDPAARQLLPRK